MAMKIKVISELDREERPFLLEKMAMEIREADPGLDPEAVRELAERSASRRLVGIYQIDLRDQALKLLDAAEKEGAISAVRRPLVKQPTAAEMEDLADMFRVTARRLGYKVSEPDQESRLEQWARGRLVAAGEIERECRVGDGDTYYLDAMRKWDLENLDQLAEVRHDLLPHYRKNRRTGEEEPGPRVTEKDGRRTVEPKEWKRYFGERVAWLRTAIQDLDGAS